ncbi:hypothetical protein HYT05_04810, partial [Candidatus Kaiserbacteria bacterium]|nr:hypothetical protein [Candidatus Kaiserbacteria bacterium]
MSFPKTKRKQRLSPEEWAELGERILNGDQKAYDKLVLDYQPLMRKIAWDIARKFDSSNNGNNLIEELLAEGTVALCEAARNWDHKKCWLFSKYAQQWIWGRVMDA